MSDCDPIDTREMRKLLARTRAVCYVTIGLVVLVATLGMVGSGEETLRAGTLYAKRVVIEDVPSGKEVGTLEAQSGCGVLILRGKAPDSGIQLCGGRGEGAGQSAAISMKDGAGTARIVMEVRENEGGPSTITITDPFRKETGFYPARVELVLREHRAGVFLFDGNGKEIARLPDAK